jgi:hypothetical protein
MRHHGALDERETEAVLAGRVPAARPDLEPLARFVRSVHAEAAGPAPVPSGPLARVLATGVPPAGAATPGRPRRATTPERRGKGLRGVLARAAARAAGVALWVKLATVSLVTVAGVTGAGAAGVLPDPVQAAVADSVDTVTPFHLPHPDPPNPGGGIGEPGPAGKPGGRSGNGGTSGEDAGHVGRDRHHGKPSDPGHKGLDRANDGPAAPHAPDSVPGGGKPPAAPGQSGQSGQHKDPDRDRDRDNDKDDKDRGRDGGRDGRDRVGGAPPTRPTGMGGERAGDSSGGQRKP